MKRMLIALACTGVLVGCANMTQGQQRALGGTAIGATGGAIIGAMAGNAGLGTAIGAGAGLAVGLIYNKVKQDQQSAYEQGYAAGKTAPQ